MNEDSNTEADDVDFVHVNRAALGRFPALLLRWLPRGKFVRREYTARNPRRDDRHLGSFWINIDTGRWIDFATGAAGGDPVSLAAFLSNTGQVEAARNLADMLGIDVSP